jgi:hypothetical protein
MAGHGLDPITLTPATSTSAASRPACGKLDRATLLAHVTIIIHYIDY